MIYYKPIYIYFRTKTTRPWRTCWRPMWRSPWRCWCTAARTRKCGRWSSHPATTGAARVCSGSPLGRWSHWRPFEGQVRETSGDPVARSQPVIEWVTTSLLSVEATKNLFIAFLFNMQIILTLKWPGLSSLPFVIKKLELLKFGTALMRNPKRSPFFWLFMLAHN